MRSALDTPPTAGQAQNNCRNGAKRGVDKDIRSILDCVFQRLDRLHRHDALELKIRRGEARYNYKMENLIGCLLFWSAGRYEEDYVECGHADLARLEK